MSGLQPKKILVAVDFSKQSVAAVDRAIEIAGSESTVEVIYVLHELLAVAPGNLFGTITDDPRIGEAKGKFRETFSEAKYEKLLFHIFIGDPGREITSFAQREQFDLIVIASHGHGFVKHMLLGSVAERVARLATCPVLVWRS